MPRERHKERALQNEYRYSDTRSEGLFLKGGKMINNTFRQEKNLIEGGS